MPYWWTIAFSEFRRFFWPFCWFLLMKNAFCCWFLFIEPWAKLPRRWAFALSRNLGPWGRQLQGGSFLSSSQEEPELKSLVVSASWLKMISHDSYRRNLLSVFIPSLMRCLNGCPRDVNGLLLSFCRLRAWRGYRGRRATCGFLVLPEVSDYAREQIELFAVSNLMSVHLDRKQILQTITSFSKTIKQQLFQNLINTC